MPSVKHVQAIQDLIKQKNVICIFAEPQFKPAIVDMIASGTGVREGTLKPKHLFCINDVILQGRLLQNGSQPRYIRPQYE